MSTTITSVQFGASMWVPRTDPPRAVMPIVVTVGGFDTSDHVAVDAGVSHRALDGARAAHKAPQTYPSSDITDATNTTISPKDVRVSSRLHFIFECFNGGAVVVTDGRRHCRQDPSST